MLLFCVAPLIFLGGKQPHAAGTSRPHRRAGVVARWKFQDVAEDVAFRGVQRGTGETEGPV